MKTIIIYKSKTGFVKKYAEWIAKDLLADIYEVSKVNVNTLTKYDAVIYGGSLHAVGINGVKFITRNIDKLMGKRVVVFASGASPSSEKVIKEVITRNFTSDQQKHIKFFYLQGGFNYNKLSSFDKVLMTLLKWNIKNKKKKKKELTSDEIGMLEVLDKPADFTRKSNIDEIVNYVNS
ncbi:Protoporphyrinogen IX oxidase, menaquinone-dependent (flavodoxin domain) [Proteiniborus ethanoligenes]|uniref:Protoporphyrinogen IX oxidase, menaquinone-dependent (Flavodoxin domain) n=1 Tax=Proteiniborus ethanoligenes TaxID=415015 RepID=A0A1H3KMV0_9FIRM|nr:flavodoxin domain-containing protein [Proteiniborus ethanoligenes]SDY53497.1 Protoporphyrinogen IX oxidase, menaquinone-dependent (flavodoxin domain) [Proteiniborus ethanoligenes]